MGFLANIFTGGGGFGGDIAQDLTSGNSGNGGKISTGTVNFGSKGISNGVLIAAIGATALVVYMLKK